MPKKLDYSAAWSDAVGLLNAHREAVIAIAGFFVFATAWALAFLVPNVDLQGATTPQQIIAIAQNHFVANWMYIVPATIIATYGGFVIYVLLSGQNLPTVGDSLTIALSRFLPFFIASIVTGWLTTIGLVFLILPGLYLFARFALTPAAMAADTKLGIIDGIKQSWAATQKVGWKTFLLLFVVWAVSWLLMTVVNTIIGIVCAAIAGPEGVPLIQTFFAALFSTVQGLIIIALVTAIYRQLRPQGVTQ